jgi:predicted transport protein
MDIIKIENHIQSTGDTVYIAWRYDRNNNIICYVAVKANKQELIIYLQNGGNYWSQDAKIIT